MAFNHPLLTGMSPADREVFAKSLRDSLTGANGVQNVSTGEMLKTATANVGVTTPLGLLGYPLEAPAKLLYPVPTPLRNSIPREVVGGNAINYRTITAINKGNLWGSVAEATSATTGCNSFISFDEADKTLTFKSVEMETLLTPEAQFGANSRITPGQDFQAEEFATLSLLQSTMLAEEMLDLGGNVTALGAGPTCTKTGVTQAVTNVGSLTNGTNYYVAVSGLTLQGYRAGVTGQGGTGSDVQGETVATEVTIATTAGGNAGDKAITIKWPALKGAVAYNVYIGAATGVANSKYFGTYTSCGASGVTVDSVPATARANGADKTANALDYDGLVALCNASTAGYYKDFGGATFTGDSTTGVEEFDAAFLSFFNTYKVSPDAVWVNATQKKKIDQIIMGSAAPIVRIEGQMGSQDFVGTMAVKSVMNRYLGAEVPIKVHPFLPAGTALMVTQNLGAYYPNSRIANNLTKHLSWDYRKIDYALAERGREMGVDFRGALTNYAPFAMGVLQNIA